MWIIYYWQIFERVPFFLSQTLSNKMPANIITAKLIIIVDSVINAQYVSVCLKPWFQKYRYQGNYISSFRVKFFHQHTDHLEVVF